jgi:hypothetical protein|tara:strand:- start:55 stop:258 length:204 start_codon:yes stop_codon:yes gene_type:complete
MSHEDVGRLASRPDNQDKAVMTATEVTARQQDWERRCADAARLTGEHVVVDQIKGMVEAIEREERKR